MNTKRTVTGHKPSEPRMQNIPLREWDENGSPKQAPIPEPLLKFDHTAIETLLLKTRQGTDSKNDPEDT